MNFGATGAGPVFEGGRGTTTGHSFGVVRVRGLCGSYRVPCDRW